MDEGFDSFEGYAIEQLLGSGGIADVYAARRSDPERGVERVVALKMLRDTERSGAYVRRFLREGQLLRRLKHPQLRACLEVHETPRPYLVLDLLEGQTLSEYLKAEGNLGPDRVMDVAHAMLRVLGYLHANGVVHRDVKAGNIFLCEDGRVFLTDLGLAADPADLLTTTLGDVMGTFAYMAPEQIAGGEVDHRCDLYSLGITLYEALSGKRPYRARGAAGYLRAHRQGRARALSDLAPQDTPARLVHLIERLMARAPTARPSSAAVARAVLTGESGHRDLRQPPLVGRSAVLGAIEGVLDGGGVVHLFGEPGMGLGRAARLAWKRAREEGGEIISLRCGPRMSPSELLGQLAWNLERLSGPVEAAPGPIAKALGDQAAEGPLLLILEDHDQARPEAIAQLGAVVARSGVPALTTGGAPPASPFAGHPLELRALSLLEVRQLLAGMLGTSSTPAGFAERLHRFTGGLPAAAVATIRDFYRRGLLRCEGLDDEGELRWIADRSAKLLPETSVRALFHRQFEALNGEERALLQVISAAGEELPLDTALRAAGLDDSSVAPLKLDQLRLASERVSNVRGSYEIWIGLRRPLIGALVIDGVTEERQRHLHARLARALARAPSTPWRDERLPYHQALSVPPGQAARALVGLGDWLAEQERHLRALELLDRLSEIPDVDPLTAIHGALARASALLGLSRAEQATAAFQAARRLALDQDRPDLGAQAALGLGRVQLYHGEIRRALDLADDIIEFSSDGANDPVLPVAWRLKGESLHYLGRPFLAEEALQESMDFALVQGRHRESALARGALGSALLSLGELDEAVVHIVEAADALRGYGPGESLVLTLCDLVECRRRQGRVDEAVHAAREAARLAHELQMPRLVARVGTALSTVYRSIGDLEGSGRLLRAHRAAGDAEARIQIRVPWRAALAELRQAWGDRPAALMIHQQIADEANEAGWEGARAYHAGMAAILTARGEELTDALSSLYESRERLMTARLLLEGARMTADPEILAEACEEARYSGDRFTLLAILHTLGGESSRSETLGLVGEIGQGMSGEILESFRQMPAVRWALRAGA